MDRSTLTSDEIAQRGQELYDQRIRQQVETEENIGKMVIIDVETADFAVDDTGLESARVLHQRRTGAALYGIRIGYQAAEAFGGVLERTA